MDKQADGQTDGLTNRRIDKQTDGQTDTRTPFKINYPTTLYGWVQAEIFYIPFFLLLTPICSDKQILNVRVGKSDQLSGAS